MKLKGRRQSSNVDDQRKPKSPSVARKAANVASDVVSGWGEIGKGVVNSVTPAPKNPQNQMRKTVEDALNKFKKRP